MTRRLSVKVAAVAAAAALLIEVSGGSASAQQVTPAGGGAGTTARQVTPAGGGAGTTARQEVPRGSSGASYYVVPEASGLTVADVAARVLGDPGLAAEVFALNRGRPQPDGTSLQEVDQQLHVGWRLVLPAGSAVRTGSGDVRTGTPPPVAAPAAPAVAVTTFLGLPVPEAAGIGGGIVLVVLAGLGVVLVVRRARRRSGGGGPTRHPRGSEPGAPDGDLVARRSLARALATLPPEARPHAALVGSGRTSVRLAPPLPEGPPSWRVSEQGAVWEVLDWQLEAVLDQVPGRFPLFVPVGEVDGERTAVNLGRAPGLVTFPGDLRAARAAVAGLVDRIALDAGFLPVVVVGDLPGLRVVADRVVRVRTVQEVPGPVFGQAPVPAVVLGDVWDRIVPDAGVLQRQLVVVTTPLSPADAEVLAALAARSDDTAAVLVVGDSPYAAWRFEVVGGVLDLAVLGLRLDGFPAAAGTGRPARAGRQAG